MTVQEFRLIGYDETRARSQLLANTIARLDHVLRIEAREFVQERSPIAHCESRN